MSEPALTKVVNDAACFVCGPENPIGIKAKFETDTDAHTSYTRLKLGEQFQGWEDVVHGGILATLLDEACAYACLTRADQCVTAEIKVRYRKPVPVDQELELFGQLIDCNRKVWLARSQIKIDGSLHAEAEAKMFILKATDS